jgi:TonB family protein
VIAIVGVVILAMTAEEPRFCSPDRELCLVVREPPAAQHDTIDEWLDEYPLPDNEPSEPEIDRGALYRGWPSGYQELLAEFPFRPYESRERVLVTNDGFIVTYEPVSCEADAELATIRAQDGAIVRTLLVREVFTKRDHQWLCRGEIEDVRWSIEEDQLRASVLVTDGAWDDPEARHETIDVALATGAVARPERDRCPASHSVTIETIDGVLDGALVRVMPEYPEVAWKARIAGSVRVDLVVGADGNVEAARVQPFAFGLDAAVKAAIAQWKFAPAPDSVSGAVVFDFMVRRPPRILTRTIRN